MSTPATLSHTELLREMMTLQDWRVENGVLRARFTFANFTTTFRFMALVAHEAERLNHHPTWTNTYNVVEVSLSTHDAGESVTERDITLARVMSEAAEKFNK